MERCTRPSNLIRGARDVLCVSCIEELSLREDVVPGEYSLDYFRPGWPRNGALGSMPWGY